MEAKHFLTLHILGLVAYKEDVMSKPNIAPEKIKSPIQLMAAWFVMLILLSGVLLTAATQISEPKWAAGYLIISTTILIVGVIGCVILMLTKFRPNLQEGKEYAEWLKYQNIYSEGEIIRNIHSDTSALLKGKLKQIIQSQDETITTDKPDINSLFHVSISDLPGARDIVELLKEIGIDVEIYSDPIVEKKNDTLSKNAAIWLGDEVPVKLSLQIIKRAFRVWPHLKYIHLSTDSASPEEMDWEVYIGGSTSTAVEMFNMSAWSKKEVNMLSEEMKLVDFHSEIRKKYP